MVTIYDAVGDPYTPPKQPDRRHIAAVGIRDRFSSYPSKGLTPQRLAQIFREADQGSVYRQAELFEEMEEKDTHLGSVLQTRKLAVVGLDYEIIPANDDDKAKEIAEYVRQQVENFEKWEELLLDIQDAMGKGVSVNELIWDVSEGQAVITSYEYIHPKYLTFLDNSRILQVPRLLTDNEPVKGEELIPLKFVYHRFKARSGHPSRQGLIRTCAWPYLFRNYTLKDWIAFAEVFGMPLRIGRYDPNTSEADKETLINAVINLGSDAAAVISKSTEIELKEAQQKGTVNVYDVLYSAMGKEMSKAVLGQTGTTEETPGKLGGSPEKAAVRQDLLEADAKAVQKTIKEDMFRPLVGFNYGWDQIHLTPKLKLAYEPPGDQLAEARKHQILVRGVGMPMGRKYLYEKFGIPIPEENEEVIAPPQQQPGGNLSPALSAQSATIDDRALSRDNQQATIDSLADEALGQAAGKYQALLEPVMAMIKDAGSLKEIRLNLAELYPDMDTGELEDLLGQALYIADLAGRVSASQ